jgi:hypothetical protein
VLGRLQEPKGTSGAADPKEMTIKEDDRRGDGDGEAWRVRLAAGLKAQRAERDRLWGGIDEMTLARYEAGVSPEAERLRVEQAMRDHPALRECLEFAQELSAAWQAAPVAGTTAATGRPDDKPSPAVATARSIPLPDTTDETVRFSRQMLSRRRWLTIAAAVAAILGLGFVYRYAWRQIGPELPPDVVDDDSRTPGSSPSAIVEKGAAPSARRPTFEEAVAALKKRAAAGGNMNELEKEFQQLLKDYPGHAAPDNVDAKVRAMKEPIVPAPLPDSRNPK